MKTRWHIKNNKRGAAKTAAAAAALLTGLSLAASPLAAAGPLCSAPGSFKEGGAPAYADSKKIPQDVDKAEVVYAKLDGSGAVENAYVVNRFVGPSGSRFDDFGEYEEVSQISLAGEMTEGKDVASISLGEDPFYYQGKLKNKTLPWLFRLTYKLDGKEIKAADLSGKSGKLELDLKVEPNPDCRRGKDGSNPWAESNMLQIAVTFPSEVTIHLQAEGGTIAQVGSDQQVTYIVLPNSDGENFKITADVKNFYMPSMQIAGLPFSMDLSTMDLPDISDNKDFKDLKDGTKKLSDGSKDLAEGLKALNDGSKTLQETLKQLSEGSTKLKDNSAELNSGLKQYTDGADQLAAKGGQISDGLNGLKQGADELSGGMDKASQGVKDYVDGVGQYVAGVDQLAANLPAVSSGVKNLEQGAEQLAAGAEQLGDGSALLQGSAEIKAALNQMSQGLAQLGTPQDIEALKAQLQSMGSAAGELKTNSAQFKTSIESVRDAVSGLTQAAKGLDTALGQIAAALENADRSVSKEELGAVLAQQGLPADILNKPEMDVILTYIEQRNKTIDQQIAAKLEGLRTTQDPQQPAPLGILLSGLDSLNQQLPLLAGGYAEFDAALAQLADALPQLAKLTDLLELASGINQLAASYESFDSGLNAYIGGVNQLTAQIKKPAEGKENIYSGITALSGGLEQLAAAGDQLNKGSTALTGDNAKALKDGQNALAGGMHDLNGGIAELQNGYAQYYDGVKSLSAGSDALRSGAGAYTDGVKALADGLEKWAAGYKDFADGLNKAEDGSKDLAAGTETLHKGTQSMDENIIESINEMLDDYQQLDGPKESFASEKNGDVDHVQFVIMTEGVPEPEKAQAEEEASEKKNFWDRFLDLFR